MASSEKHELHPDNKHRAPYDFTALSIAHPELKDYLIKNDYGNISLDFSQAAAVKALNTAILLDSYKIDFWDIPEGYLCPPIPSRADYLHYLNDLLGKPKKAKIFDLGAGANCVYPLLGQRLFNWDFVCSEIDEIAQAHIEHLLKFNSLQKKIKLRKQKDASSYFEGVIHPDEKFEACMCNPPFFLSAEHAQEANARKWKKLKKKGSRNFGGQHNELWCKGGEVAFIKGMIAESRGFRNQFEYFTVLVSRKNSLDLITPSFQDENYEIIEMAQGRKISRILVWK